MATAPDPPPRPARASKLVLRRLATPNGETKLTVDLDSLYAVLVDRGHEDLAQSIAGGVLVAQTELMLRQTP